MTTSITSRPRHKSAPIVFISTMASDPWGGSEELWSRTALHLHSKGKNVHASVIAWNERPRMIHTLLQAEIPIHFRPRTTPRWHRLLDFIHSDSHPWKLTTTHQSWLMNLHPSLVVISQGGPWDGLSWMRACRQSKLKYVIVVHANSESWWPEDEWLDEIHQAYLNAERVYFVSHSNKKLFEYQTGLDLFHSEVIENPWNDAGHERATWPPETNGMRLACIGRLDPRAKGQDLAISVLANDPWKSLPLHLTFYGTGPCEQSLRLLAKRCNAINLSFAGHVGEPSHIWSRNHALFLPSRHEGLPLVIVEAMRHGRMVITTDVAGNAEYLQDGENGFISPAAARGPLNDTLLRAWEARSRWREMGIRAKADIKKQLKPYPVEYFANQLIL